LLYVPVSIFVPDSPIRTVPQTFYLKKNQQEFSFFITIFSSYRSTQIINIVYNVLLGEARSAVSLLTSKSFKAYLIKNLRTVKHMYSTVPYIFCFV
jgi:hypothetical protein